MPGIGNNLYPPIIQTYMPAFIRTSACKVYFSLSKYNSLDEIRNAQVIVNNQITNLSVLDDEKYPTGIKIANISVDSSATTDERYYVTIDPSDIQDGEFEIDQYYRVQIRFTGTGAEVLTDDKKIAAWLVNNQAYFSEWSTVCLIKGIEKPKIYLKNFEDLSSSQINFLSDTQEFVGQLYYENNAEREKEYLEYYQIKLYDASGVNVLFDSGVIYSNYYNPNEINYMMPYRISAGTVYNIDFTYVTNNNYTETLKYNFISAPVQADKTNATIDVELDQEYGCAKITVTSTGIFFGNLVIRRTSSESNYTIWEDLKTEVIDVSTGGLNYVFYDYTIQSGVWYKYGIQRRNAIGDRSNLVIAGTGKKSDPGYMMLFDDIFLTRKDFQLTVKFDPDISSFKHQVMEAKVDTIGSKYPFIRRNANVEYKTFPLSGTISGFSDFYGRFLSRDIIFQDKKENYDKFNDEHDINPFNDFIYEKEFRDRVIKFLYSNNVMLFRSNAEGNILVRLMDVSFTPNRTLGRMIYSFSATAYEIDECTIENYTRYGIQDGGEFVSYVHSDSLKVHQLRTTLGGQDKEVIKMVQAELDSIGQQEFEDKLSYLKWVRFEIESLPYLIKTNGANGLEALSGPPQDGDNVVLGYIIYVNQEPIYVSPKGFYELRGPGVEVTSQWSPQELKVNIDYLGFISRSEKTKVEAKKLTNSKGVGQLFGKFDVDQLISNDIYIKYKLDYPTYFQKLLSIDMVSIEAVPGAVIYVKDSFDDKEYRHEIGPTSVLELYDDESVIEKLYFHGIHLNKSPDVDRDEVRENEYEDSGITVASLDLIEEPKRNFLYHLTNGENYIYFDGAFYIFTNSHDVLCPVLGLVTYVYETMKGEY